MFQTQKKRYRGSDGNEVFAYQCMAPGRVTLPDGTVQATRPGDWIVRSVADGGLAVVKPKDFDYTLLKTRSPIGPEVAVLPHPDQVKDDEPARQPKKKTSKRTKAPKADPDPPVGDE